MNIFDVLYVLVGVGLVKSFDFFLNLKKESNKHDMTVVTQLQTQMNTMNTRVKVLEEKIEKQSKIISKLQKENGILETENKHLNKEIELLKGDG